MPHGLSCENATTLPCDCECGGRMHGAVARPKQGEVSIYNGSLTSRNPDTAFRQTWEGSRLRLDADPNIAVGPTEPVSPESLRDNPIIVTPDGEILDGYHRIGGVLSKLTGITDPDHEWEQWPTDVEAKIPVVVVYGTDYQAYVADEFATTPGKQWKEALRDAKEKKERDG